VTNVADAFNLAAGGDTRTGMRVLEPGERFSATALLGLAVPRAGRP
jgi:aldose 1-epimerase